MMSYPVFMTANDCYTQFSNGSDLPPYPLAIYSVVLKKSLRCGAAEIRRV